MKERNISLSRNSVWPVLCQSQLLLFLFSFFHVCCAYLVKNWIWQDWASFPWWQSNHTPCLFQKMQLENLWLDFLSGRPGSSPFLYHNALLVIQALKLTHKKQSGVLHKTGQLTLMNVVRCSSKGTFSNKKNQLLHYKRSQAVKRNVGANYCRISDAGNNRRRKVC